MKIEIKKLKPPISLLILDAIGAVLLGLGLAEWFAKTDLVPKALQFENYYIIMVVIGVLLMLPIMVFFLKVALGEMPREI